ncbi:uncharacterized protein CTRU02_206969 [Colletotrichum truncatum]|uniref:Uncharacterized protein n=1 Tax=Colletotrichum truncatum TaxID=5467 RepID=A0ACC3YZ41_COLTU|nr:uncharacterized protein CTRU02_11177 [Colletotrichum truncatum]KAF6786306.1 hypothetical protein CTRU02_11177 [Colletotrichum truncatum]
MNANDATLTAETSLQPFIRRTTTNHHSLFLKDKGGSISSMGIGTVIYGEYRYHRCQCQ